MKGSSMKITFLGACGTVTGSKYRVAAGARTRKGSVPFFGLIALVTEAEPVKRILTHTPACHQECQARALGRGIGEKHRRSSHG